MAKHGDELCFRYSTRCALCRMRLPNPDIEKPGEEAWEYEVLVICNLSTSEEHPRIFTTQANLKDLGTFLTPRSRSSIKFYSQSERQHGKIAHIVHKCCWKLIISRTSHSFTSIYRFARSRYPLFDTGNTFDSEHDTLMDLTNDTIADLSNTRLKKLLEQLIIDFPPEIRLIVAKYCSPCLISSLHTVKRIQSLDISGAHSLQTVVKYRNNTHYLAATQTPIFGEDYISSIAFNKSKGILVSSAKFKGIVFTIGRYGLRALRIIYADNSTSAWLGDPENGWTGVMYSNNIQELHVIHENLKLLRIDLKGNATGVEAASRVLWDSYLHLPSLHHHYVLDTNPDGSTVDNFPGWRLCEYLPFVDDSSSISGLSMYCSGHGVTGIATHGQIQKQIGQCQGCPIYFNLQPRERIVSIWLRMPAHGTPLENEPSILVTTNFNRSCMFGPCLSQSLVTACRYAWTPLTQNSTVLGMFNDILAVQRCSRMTNIGIAQDIEVQPEFHAEDLPRIPFPHHRPGIPQSVGTGTYFSDSKLDQISGLRVCQRGVRYIGMSIEHHGGRIDVVGQWDCQYSNREIYNPNNGALSSITFRLSKGASGFYVDGIFVVVDGADFPKITPTNQSRLVCLELPSERSLAWWFTRDYDEVEPWDAVYKDIDVSTENYSIVELK